jgi:hypothetical protein
MKRIELGAGYVIDVDSHNFTLKSNVRETVKDGETIEACTTHGYFGTLEQVLKDFLKERTIEKIDGKISLAELRNIIIETKKEIEGVCNQLGL